MTDLAPSDDSLTPAAPADEDAAHRARRAARLAPLVVALATAVAFVGVLDHPFSTIDDTRTVALNPRWGHPDRPPAWSATEIGYYWGHAEHGLYIPLTYTVWGLCAQFAWRPAPDKDGLRFDATPFHAASLIVHVLAALGAYALLVRLTRGGSLGVPGDRDRSPAGPWVAAIGALVFALHPLQVESVAWASGLKDVLAGAGSLWALALYVTATSRPRLRRLVYLGATVCLALALLSKPSAITVPVIAAVIDLVLRRAGWRAAALRLLPWVVMAIPIVVITARVQIPAEQVTIPPIRRPVLAGASLAFYLGKVLWPSGLTFDHGWRPPTVLGWPYVWALALVPVGAAALLVAFRRRRAARPLAAGLLVMAAALGPVLGLTPFMFQFVSNVAEHYMYVAMLGPAIVAAWLAARLRARAGADAGWLPALPPVALLAAYVGLCFYYVGFWRTPQAHTRRLLDVNPDSVFGLNDGGLFLLIAKPPRLAEAEACFRRATAIAPEWDSPHLNLLTALSRQGKVGETIAELYRFRELNARVPAEIRRRDVDTWFFQAGVQEINDRHFDRAVRYLEESLKVLPNHADSARALTFARDKLAAPGATTKPR